LEWIIEEFKKDQGNGLSKDKMALQGIRKRAKKQRLNFHPPWRLKSICPLHKPTRRDQAPVMKLTRAAEFEQLAEPLFKRLNSATPQALKDAQLDFIEALTK